MSLAALAGIAASSLVFGSWDAWPAWLESLREFGQGSSPDQPMRNNVSTARILLELTGRDASGALSALLWITAAAWIWLHRAPAGGPVAFRTEAWAVGLACLFPLIAAPIAWTHYFVLSIPLLVLLISRPPGPEPGVRATVQPGLAMIATLVLAVFPLKEIAGVQSRVGIAIWTSGALVLCLGLALVWFRAEAGAGQIRAARGGIGNG
jgi:hypothetical protein